MTEINIEVNIEDTKWEDLITDVEKIIKKSCIAALKASGICTHTKNIEISILLTNDEAIQELNSDYRYKNKPTNVLSFPQEELTAGIYKKVAAEIILGDIIFAIETIQNEAIAENKIIAHHLAHLAVHGTLHLLGYDHEDEDDAEKMEALEIQILAAMGIATPY